MAETTTKRGVARIVAKAIFYASIQASLGSVEMSSKFSVVNFSKDQETLQRAADALRSYIIIGSVWSVGTMLALYSSYGMMGAWIGLFFNALIMGWIVMSYMQSFTEAAKRYGLNEPTILSPSEKVWGVMLVAGVGILVLLIDKNMLF